MSAAFLVGWFALPWTLAMGGAGLPLGVPPLPEDPLLAQVAPDHCLWYMSSAGLAQPDAGSDNRTEKLLAEPEVQYFLHKLDHELSAAVARQGRKAQWAITLLRPLLTRPLAAYVASAVPGPNSWQLDAGLVIDLGKQRAEVQQVLKSLENQIAAEGELEVHTQQTGGLTWKKIDLPQGAPPIAWAEKGDYLLVAVGEQSDKKMLARMQTDPPPWLTRLRQEMPVQRASTVTYLNADAVIKMALGVAGFVRPSLMQIATELGITDIETLASVTGLDEEGYVSLSSCTFKDGAQGVLADIGARAVRRSDLEMIPGDAVIAASLRLDISGLLRRGVEVIERAEPRTAEQLDQALNELARETGIDLQRDLLKGLGDTWTVWASPADGGFPWVGAVAAIEIRDRERLLTANGQLLQLVRRGLGQGQVRDIDFAGQRIFFLSIADDDVPVAPAWCLTDQHLLVAMYPQAIKAALSRDEDAPTLDDNDAVRAAFAGGETPFAVTYCDSKSLLQTLYPVAQIMGRIVCGEAQREGVDLDISMLPTARSISRHLQPSVSTARRTERGFLVIRRQTIPGGDALSSAPVLAAMTVPLVYRVRQDAQSASDMNRLRQIGLAMHVHHDQQGSFPAAAWGTGEKPGLSWRVKLLPYLEQQELYDQFHHDEPWDSEHNLKLIPKMPAFYRPARGIRTIGVVAPLPLEDEARHAAQIARQIERKYAQWKTTFLVVRSPASIFPPPQPDDAGATRLRDIVDGTSNTVLVVEAGDRNAVIWTKPEDISLDDGDRLRAALLGDRESFLALFADAHVARIGHEVNGEKVKAMVTRNGSD